MTATNPLPMDATRNAAGAGRTAIVVLGMHRSGTSALTWLIGRMGAALPADAMPASADNSRGYHESVGLAKAGERLLRAARSSWFDPRPLGLDRLSDEVRASHRIDLGQAIEAAFGDASLFAIKDPRQCRFAPLLRETLAERGIAMRAVLMVRGADPVAASLGRRDGTTLAFARLLWLRHMLDAERDTRDLPRAILRYDRLLNDWSGEVRRLAPLIEASLPDGFEGDADAFVDRELRHHASALGASDFAELDALVRAGEEALDALAEQDGEAPRAALDRIAARLREAPWIADDAIHDELRHRRVSPAGVVPSVEAAREPVPQPEPATPPEADPDLAETIRVIESSGLFDRDYYLANYPDVASSDLDPIAHYVEIGAPEGRNPSALFDTAYYARQMARRRGGAA